MRHPLSPGYTRCWMGLGFLLALTATALGVAESVVLVPVADTTLIEVAPTNNLGGNSFFNAGTTDMLKRNRGLIRFDPAAAVSGGALITNVSLTVEVTGQPLSPGANSSFTLHRLLKPWGEGDKVGQPGSLGLGQAATTGEATWIHRQSLTTNIWTLPGGAADADYLTTPSGSIFVYGTDESPYTFSGARMTADVQTWLDQPDTNFGWLILSGAEATRKTARRFAAREDADRQPRLRVDYTPPPRIQSASLAGNLVILEFDAAAGQQYSVEYRNSLVGTPDWAILTNLPVPAVATQYSVTDQLHSPQRFYRLSLP